MKNSKIVLQPLNEIDRRILEILRQSLENTFKSAVKVKAQISSMDYAYVPNRKQYLTSPILSALGNCKMETGYRCLGIVDVDLYSPGLNFVFGQADISAGMAIISLHRLRQERYGMPPDEKIFQERVIKEAVHELGHTYYLNHCPNVRCVMHFSNSLSDTDIKEANFCSRCQKKLEEALIKV